MSSHEDFLRLRISKLEDEIESLRVRNYMHLFWAYSLIPTITVIVYNVIFRYFV